MTPFFWTRSKMSLTWLDSTMDFQQFCLISSPLPHIFSSGLNCHFSCCSMPLHADIITPAILTLSLKPKYMAGADLKNAVFLPPLCTPMGDSMTQPLGFSGMIC